MITSKAIKSKLTTLVMAAAERAAWPAIADISDAGLERTRDPKHGDFACNLAMRLAKTLQKSPRELANQLIQALNEVDTASHERLLESVTIAGPGFVNLTLKSSVYHQEISQILTLKARYGEQGWGAGQKVLLEFVSANPTGPLHVGHGRHAAYGAVLYNLLRATGHDVTREFYINDAGRQVDILGVSVWVRYLQSFHTTIEFPSNGYQGEYLLPIAAQIKATVADKYLVTIEQAVSNLPADEPHGGDKERHIDGWIERARQLLGDTGFSELTQFALNGMQADIQDDLSALGVEFDVWFSERSLSTSGKMTEALKRLADNQQTYLKDGALWFKAQSLGDDEDRVIRRENGLTTYFASDIAYHLDKRLRGFEHLIDVWGADHHGYIARVKAGLQAMGQAPDSLEVVLLQLVNLYRNGQKVAMGKREGNFVTLRQLYEEVGKDACRFYYVARSHDQMLDFDLDLAKKRSTDNPLFYIQYAHARIKSFANLLKARKLDTDMSAGLNALERLTLPHERRLMVSISQYPEALTLAAKSRTPHSLVQYLRDLAQEFHLGYALGNENPEWRTVVDDANLRYARLTLGEATAQVLSNGLGILGVSAPDSM